MSAWFAAAACTLILAASGALYVMLDTIMEREDAQFARDAVENIRLARAGAPIRAEACGAALGASDHQFYLRLLSADGAVACETTGMRDIAPPPALEHLKGVGAAPVRRELAARPGEIFESVVATLAPDGSRASGFIQIAIDRSQEEGLMARYRRRMVLIVAVVLGAVAGLGVLIARAGMRPVERIGALAARISSHTLHERISSAELPPELLGLARTFNTMLDRLQDSFTSVSRFSDDVAHELRGPINNMRGELEVALARARTPAEYREAMSSAVEECDRISRIVNSLIFLARTNGQTALSRTTLEVRRELAAVLEFYGPTALERGVSIKLDADAKLTAQLDRTLFQQAVANLVANAIAHTPAGGDICVRAARETGGAGVEVCDSGPGIAPEHLPHVFERFYRADPARSGGEHFGLGLAIVRNIVERHGGRAQADNRPGGGARFHLFFPE